MRAAKTAFIVVGLFALEGCVSAAISVVSMAGGAALRNVTTEPVHQNVPSPMAGARLAALKTIDRMAMVVEKDERREDRWTIVAKADNREVKVELVALGHKRVRMSLEGGSGDFVITKDTATADEFSHQMDLELSRLTFNQVRIATVQMLLDELGYGTNSAAGVMDHETRKAIRRFQRKTNVRADGKVSDQLITMLRNQR
jgi:hypothetical protein